MSRKKGNNFLITKSQAEGFRTIDSSDSGDDMDIESQSSKGSSKDGHFSTFSSRSFPRRQKKTKKFRSVGYNSENDVSSSLRADLRRDMQVMMRDVVRAEMSQQPVVEATSYQHGGGIHGGAIPPFQQMNIPVNQTPSMASYIMPFLCGCVLSCIGLSYLALILFALLRQ